VVLVRQVLLKTLVAVAVVLVGIGPAEAQRRRRPRNEEAALAQRVADLVAAAGLTEAQARSVFAQIRRPPLSPLVHSVVDERRLDGTRNVFGFLEVDGELECRLEGFDTPRECRERRGGVLHVLFTQVAPDGRIARTAYATPFSHVAGDRRQDHRPTTLRLFAPSPGAAKVVLVDGATANPRTRVIEGEVYPPSYDHEIWVWDGRRDRRYIVSQVGDPNDAGLGQALGAVNVDEVGRRLVASQVSCRDGCRCPMPMSMERETAALATLARQGAACAAQERALELPPSLRLVDDDLEAVTPRAALTNRWPALARAAGLGEPQATAIVRALRSNGFPLAPRFGRFATHTAGDSTKHIWGVVGESPLEECAHRYAQDRSMYDAVRACADETGVQNRILYAQIGADGDVRAQTLTSVGHRNQVGELYLVRAGDAIVAAVDAWNVTPSAEGYTSFYRHEVFFVPGSFVAIGQMADPPDHRDERYVGEVVARSAGGGLSTLHQRRAPCSRECPCAPFPSDPTRERAILTARANAADARCRPRPERPIAPPSRSGG
jgi:hypothetical protein